MAITKILPRNSGLKAAIQYVLNGEKTQEQVFTAHLNCEPGHEYQEMMDTKRALGKLDGRQCYHIIQSFAPGEITPELALEIATQFAQEHLPGYETVIGVHTDRKHIHAHILFNSVNADTGKKYHCSNGDYYKQIRAVSDRLCREHGLSVITQGESAMAVNYGEWLRLRRGLPTFRSMLEADLELAIEDANSIGDFYMLMENMGYEINHGNRLGFRLRGQEQFMIPERKNPRYSEDGIRRAICGNLDAIEAGMKPVLVYREPYKPFKKHPKYTGFLALYVHYLYVFGKIQKQQYPPHMTAHMKAEIAKSEKYREQFEFLREHDISTSENLEAFKVRSMETLAALTKQRTILNVQKKKCRKLFDALADVEALAPVKEYCEQGLPGMKAAYQTYRDAAAILDACGISFETLSQQKSELYTKLADINREIRLIRKQLKTCKEIQEQTPRMERELRAIEPRQKEHRWQYKQER